MKKIIYLLLAITFLAGCSDDSKLPKVKPEKTGTVKDSEGNEYTWVRYNGLDWLASNFRAGDPYYDATVFYEDWYEDMEIAFSDYNQAVEDYKIYGNLYSYEDAVKNADMLEGDGWRLPTDEDWQKLEQALGMSAKTAARRGWRGTPAGELLQQGGDGSGLHLLLGGYVTMKKSSTFMEWAFTAMRESGYYWTSTKVDCPFTLEGDVVYYRRIIYNSSEVEREQTSIMGIRGGMELFFPKFMSVRYVRNAQD